MKKFFSLLFALSFLFPNQSYAQSTQEHSELSIPELSPGEKDPGEVVSPLKIWQKAPFTGVLLSPSAVAKIVVELSTIDEKIQIEVNKTRSEEIASCDKKLADTNTKFVADKRILEAKVNSLTNDYRLLDNSYKKLKEEHESEWSPQSWVGIGVASGIVVTVITAFAITQAIK